MSCTWRPDESGLADVARLFGGGQDDPGALRPPPESPAGAADERDQAAAPAPRPDPTSSG